MPTKEQLTEYIKEKYNPVAIVLHGSRANGNAREHSDWDFLIFTQKETKTHRVIKDGANIEIKDIRLPLNDSEIKGTFGFYFRKENVEILLDPTGIAADLLSKNEKIINEGNQFIEEDRIARFAFLSSSLDGIRDYKENSLAVFSKKADFYDRLIPAWFRFFHKEFKPSDYLALPRIKKDDPKFFILLERFVSADAETATVVGGEILKHLFPDL